MREDSDNFYRNLARKGRRDRKRKRTSWREKNENPRRVQVNC